MEAAAEAVALTAATAAATGATNAPKASERLLRPQQPPPGCFPTCFRRRRCPRWSELTQPRTCIPRIDAQNALMLTHQPFTSEEACSAKYRRPVLLSVGFHGSLHDVCTCTVLVCVCVCQVRAVRCGARQDSAGQRRRERPLYATRPVRGAVFPALVYFVTHFSSVALHTFPLLLFFFFKPCLPV